MNRDVNLNGKSTFPVTCTSRWICLIVILLKDAHLREIDRQEDPMLEYIRKKKEKRVQASALPRKFTISVFFIFKPLQVI